MTRMTGWLLVAAATGLGGCAAVLGPTPAPSCDGGARRPLNRSLWNWEAARPAAMIAAPVAAAGGPAAGAGTGTGDAPTPVLRKDSALPPPGRPAFDLAASLRPCPGSSDHG